MNNSSGRDALFTLMNREDSGSSSLCASPIQTAEPQTGLKCNCAIGSGDSESAPQTPHPTVDSPSGIPRAFNQRNSPLRSSLRKNRPDSSNGRHKSPAGRKTVSFCSKHPDNKRVSNVADCLSLMQAGTELIKLRTNVRQFRRIFSLDADMACIRWTPTNKKPHKARIAIDSIKEVRVGWNSELLRITETAVTPEINEECAFSIIHGDDYECLDLIALNAGDANIWVTGLMALANGSVGTPAANDSDRLPFAYAANLREHWLSNAFKEMDQETKGYISEKSAVRLIRSLNSRLQINRIKQKVKEVSIEAGTIASGGNPELTQQRGRIDEMQFIEIYKDLATRPEIYFLMVRYANKDYLNTNDLQLFLETEQGLSGISTEFCVNIIDQCEPSPEARDLNVMTVDGFSNYLLSQANSVFDSTHLNVCQDMGRHFSHYFIATSFNTYLVEDQLKGPSSLDGYTSALKRNCRYIELDVWEPDGGGNTSTDEPVIFNGGTLTSKLALGEVLDTINELAFERTRYPLFIRLELHLRSLEWQRRLVDMLEQKLGTRLYHPSRDPTDWRHELPTPKRFLNKIILTGPRYEGNDAIGEVEEEDESADLVQSLTGAGTECCSIAETSKMPMIRELRDLIAPFAVFGRAKEATDLANFSPHRHIVSMSESDCIHLLHAQPNWLYRNLLIRVTPNPQRVDSSNLNPQEFWNFGFPLVALNYQTPGLMMDLQEGKFLANGGCGYVLKPALMCDNQAADNCSDNAASKKSFLEEQERDEEGENPNSMASTLAILTEPLARIGSRRRFSTTQPQILHLKVLSAQQLPRPRASTAKGDTGLDPFVVLEVFGVPADCAEERTKTVRNDSFNPAFDESFQFTISVPELALVRFLVLDDEFIGDDFIGQYTIPFECLQSGYRHIPLLNNEGDPLEGSTLFVHIAITNRRGGGKPKKRGLSVKRKTSRVQTGLKTVGIRTIDDLFKAATGSLIQFIELKRNLEASMNIWNEESGIAANGTIRQTIVRLHGRAMKEAELNLPDTASPTTAAILSENGAIATAENDNNNIRTSTTTIIKPMIMRRDKNQLNVRPSAALNKPSEPLQKAFAALDALLGTCSTICQHSESLYISLSESIKQVANFVDVLPQMATDAGLRGQKATRAQENFAWNLRQLKAQLGLMQTTFMDARQIVMQVAESGRVLGVLESIQTSSIASAADVDGNNRTLLDE